MNKFQPKTAQESDKGFLGAHKIVLPTKITHNLQTEFYNQPKIIWLIKFYINKAQSNALSWDDKIHPKG